MSKEPNEDERFVQSVFRDRYALELRKIPESDSRRPDFEALAEGRRVGVVEVKTAEYMGLTTDLAGAEARFKEMEQATGIEGIVAGSLRNDNAVSRVASKIHDAADQLADYSEPKILVLVNDDDGADHLDLKEALQGYLAYADGSRVQTLGPATMKRLASDRAKIDLYIWIDRMGGAVVTHYPMTAVGRELLKVYFMTAQVA